MLTEDYVTRIAREWNNKDETNGSVTLHPDMTPPRSGAEGRREPRVIGTFALPQLAFLTAAMTR